MMHDRKLPSRLGPCLACSALLLIPSPGAAQETGGLEGEVLNRDHDPVVAAEVRIHALGRLVLTDSAGRFRLDDLRPGLQLLEVMSDRWGRATLPVTIEPGVSAYVIVNLSPVYHVDEIVVTAGPSTPRRWPPPPSYSG